MKIRSLLIISIIMFGCSGSEPETPERVYDLTSSLTVDGKLRTFRIHLPSTYYTKTVTFPLVIALHGGGGSGEQFETQSGLSTKADVAEFVVVYPDGLLNPRVSVRSWNAGKCCGQNASTLDTDDVGFISTLIDDLVASYNIDPLRVYALGHSNGAMLCYRIADELSNKVAAIAPNAGNFQLENAYDPARNVPVIQVISKLDENVKYNGGMTEGPGGQYNPPIDSCLNVVAAHAGCSTLKQLQLAAELYSIYLWESCEDGDFQVKLYLTEDGGHSWPGGNKGSAIADEPSQAFNSNDIIWDFFQQHKLE